MLKRMLRLDALAGEPNYVRVTVGTKGRDGEVPDGVRQVHGQGSGDVNGAASLHLPEFHYRRSCIAASLLKERMARK